MRFAGRLVLGTVLILLVTVAVLVTTAEVSLEGDLKDDFARALEREARLIAQGLPKDSSSWPEAVRDFAARNQHRVTLVDSSGRVRADSDLDPENLGLAGNQADYAEIRVALGGHSGQDERRAEGTSQSFLHVAVPGGPGAVRVSADLAPLDIPVSHARGTVLAAAFLAILIGSALAFVAGRSIAQPLTQLAGAARAIAAGNIPRFPRSGIPDIDALVRALRQMNATLAERFEALRREQGEMAAMVDSMEEGVIAADARGRIITANSAARRMLGYRPEAGLPGLLHLFRHKVAREVVTTALEGKPVAGREIELDGQVFSANARPLPEGGIVLVLFDLTEIRRLETVRRDFVANVSHELKTPLTSISGYAETLLSESPDQDTEVRFLQVILSNAHRMQRLVDSLLDLSRIEAGRWQPRHERVDLGGVAREIWQGLGEHPHNRSIRLDVELGAGAEALWADSDALRQVLTNLLDNALRYTPEGGTITVRTEPRDGGVLLSVLDTGPGIAREHLDRIFERFYRADSSRSREEGGTGLGLAIVRHLVEAHGGRVSAQSERGRGTQIRCWFPDPPEITA